MTLSTDGARAMSDTRSDLQAHDKIMNSWIIWHYYSIYREALATKNMSENLKEGLHNIMQVSNLTKARSLNFCIFNWI